MNQHLGSRLIYRSATGFEKALADVDSHRITEINAELIRSIWDPWEVPVRLLPYLAWAMGVQYWNDDWSETTKRAWVDYQFRFKSIRGTKKALEEAVRYAGRDVSRWGYQAVEVTTQPQRVFSGPSLTREQREVWLASLPQVRVWRISDPGFASPYKLFYNASNSARLRNRRFHLNGKRVFAPGHVPATPGANYAVTGVAASSPFERGRSAAFSTPSTAIERLKPRARWVEGGVETDMRVTNFGSYFQLHKRSSEGRQVYSGRPFGLGRHFLPSTAHERLVTIQPKAAMPWRGATTPTLQAVTSEPERIKVPGTRKYQVFSNLPVGGYFSPTTAPLRIFNRYAVLDPSIRQFRRTPVQFMGVGRFGFPPFTAWAKVRVGGVVKRWQAGYGFMIPGTKFFLPHDGKPIEQVRLAIQSSKALRDKIMLVTGPEPKFLAGEVTVLAEIDTMPAV